MAMAYLPTCPWIFFGAWWLAPEDIIRAKVAVGALAMTLEKFMVDVATYAELNIFT